MRIGAILLALLWFSGATYAGYRLTDRSFAWVEGPPDIASEPEAEAAPPSLDLEAFGGEVPPAMREQARTLTPQQILCLRASIAPERVSAVLAGDITPAEAAAAKKCLE